MEIGKKVLVTGSSGFLGQSICQELTANGYKVTTYDILDGKDILNIDQLLKYLECCDVCLHLAAVSDLYIADLNPSQCKKLNVDGTAIIAKACKEKEVKLLYASTCCVYGNNNVSVSDESSLPKPTEWYAESKLEGEFVVINSGCDYRILRLATFYGPKMRSSLATYVFLYKNIHNEVIDIHGNGEQTRCYTHVDDISTGIRVAYENSTYPEIINIADDVPYSVLDLIETIEEITKNKSVIRFVEDRDGQIINGSINSSLLRSWGWKPHWTLKSGLQECYNEMRTKNIS